MSEALAVSRRDVLADVLAAARVGGAVSARTPLRAPWALHFEDGARANFHVVAAGSCWLRLDDGGTALALGSGDVVLLPHGSGHVLADDLATPPVEFTPASAARLAGRGDGPPSVVLVCGAYALGVDGPSPLLRGLPEVLHLPAAVAGAEPLGSAVELLSAELGRHRQGGEVVVDRLVDLLLVYILRAWIEHQPSACPSWFAALHDPLVGPALAAMHDDPARPWTVADLARLVGLSRPTFARRFTELIGEPPLAYLTRWRMTVAAQSLTGTGASLAAVARQVGYESEFAFARAFKRVRGQAPGRYRTAASSP